MHVYYDVDALCRAILTAKYVQNELGFHTSVHGLELCFNKDVCG